MWEGQISHFSKNFRVIAYDHPGHGSSTLPHHPEGSRKIDEYGEDLICLMNELSVDKVYFCGLSLGGMVGIWLAANNPERFHKILVSNTTAKIENTELLRNRINDLSHGTSLEPIEDSSGSMVYQGNTQKQTRTYRRS